MNIFHVNNVSYKKFYTFGENIFIRVKVHVKNIFKLVNLTGKYKDGKLHELCPL